MNAHEANAKLEAGYRRKRVGHRVVLTVRDDLMCKLMTAEKERVFGLIGPAGVGKSAVIERVQAMLLEQYREAMQQDKGLIPFIHLTSKVGFDGEFNWKDFLVRGLVAGQEPLIGKKVEHRRMVLDGENIRSSRGLTTPEVSRVFEDMVKDRKCRFLFCEEASAMIDEKVSRETVRQFGRLKSLAVASGLVVVMIGAYDLLGLDRANGQILRRSQIVHMPRFQVGKVTMPRSEDCEPDEQVFVDYVQALASEAPVKIEGDFLDDASYLIYMTVGCFGIFRDWLDRACVLALVNNNGVLTEQIFKSAALPFKKLRTLLSEAVLGEADLQDDSEDQLAKDYAVTSLRAAATKGPDEKASPKGHQRRVGERGPSRDPVGTAGA